MNLYRLMLDAPPRDTREGRIFGVVPAIVTNNQDPDGLGRVKVRFPWLGDADESAWARLVVPMAGNDRGMFFLPEVDDEVLVAFAHGDTRFPYVMGSLWNGKDAPPADNGDGKNNLRVIKSRSGHLIRLNDEDGKESVEVVDRSGKNRILIDTAKNTVTICADKDIELKAPQGKIKLEAQQLELGSSAGAKLEASGEVTVKGSVINLN